MTIIARRTVGPQQIIAVDADPTGEVVPTGSLALGGNGTLWVSQGGGTFTQLTGGAEVLAMTSLFNDTGLPVGTYGYLSDGFYRRSDLTLGITQNLWLPRRVADGSPVLRGWFTGSETPPTVGNTVQGLTPSTIQGSITTTGAGGYWRLTTNIGGNTDLRCAAGQLGSNTGVYLRFQVRFGQTQVFLAEIFDGANVARWGQTNAEVLSPRNSGNTVVGAVGNLRNLGAALPALAASPALIEIIHDGRTGITTCRRDGFTYGTVALRNENSTENYIRIIKSGVGSVDIQNFVAVTFTP